MNKLMNYIAYSMGILFIISGIIIMFTNIIPNYSTLNFRVMIGIVLFLYGSFRIVTTIFKNQRND